MSGDHGVAMRLRLYEREWQFYEELSSRVPIRVPMYYGSVKDQETGLIRLGLGRGEFTRRSAHMSAAPPPLPPP